MPPMQEPVENPLATRALEEALARFEQFRTWGPTLVRARLREGSTFMVRYAQEPPPDATDAWEFQNTVVKGYRALGGT